VVGWGIWGALVLGPGCGFDGLPSGAAQDTSSTDAFPETGPALDGRAPITPATDATVDDGSPIDAASEDARPPDPVTTVTACEVSALTGNVDIVRPGDGAIAGDGVNDGVFVADVYGPAIAITLIRTDASGAPFSGQQWDTWVGTDPIPAALGTPFAVGSSTYQLGVYEGITRLNDASGRVALTAGAHVLRVAGSSVGSFTGGSYFRLVLQAPDGTLSRGPVVAF